MTNLSQSIIIRDAIVSDISRCLELDHSYETDYVWQMSLRSQGTGGWECTFKTERLPRRVTNQYDINRQRLRQALNQPHGFLIAETRDGEELLAYLTIFTDPVHEIARIHDLLVSRPYRRHKIASRLLTVSQHWAREKNLDKIILEIQTKNYPAIEFSQAHGFQFCGFHDQYLPDNDIAVFFAKTLR
ncbi:hypothetical protein MASR2M15_09960 [Anaerolineales bacterium]